VLTGCDVAGVDPLYPTLLKRLELVEAVDVMRRQLTVDLDLRGVEPERLVPGNCNENRDLGIGWIKQAFLEVVELGSNPKDVGFNLLYLVIKAAHVVARQLLRNVQARGTDQQQRNRHSTEARQHRRHPYPFAACR
jgi:hypothetical protein